ncbi:hypothetical protein [Sinanaerobacter chloroacetimidivorans]|uniref:Uncharacterized protein n=1 Tax=Sinanaerobacter chloroacetimidivorans TaxID=2818044 RepID=A0A8J8B0W2_9FIRM|nr:hypothetical protein [Sinanaerobacter chloroacetimidivorans]MBR0597041.1 hypothetical protein [Sinanaerobacter chloroacetimidivorans]
MDLKESLIIAAISGMFSFSAILFAGYALLNGYFNRKSIGVPMMNMFRFKVELLLLPSLWTLICYFIIYFQIGIWKYSFKAAFSAMLSIFIIYSMIYLYFILRPVLDHQNFITKEYPDYVKKIIIKELKRDKEYRLGYYLMEIQNSITKSDNLEDKQLIKIHLEKLIPIFNTSLSVKTTAADSYLFLKIFYYYCNINGRTINYYCEELIGSNIKTEYKIISVCESVTTGCFNNKENAFLNTLQELLQSKDYEINEILRDINNALLYILKEKKEFEYLYTYMTLNITVNDFTFFKLLISFLSYIDKDYIDKIEGISKQNKNIKLFYINYKKLIEEQKNE